MYINHNNNNNNNNIIIYINGKKNKTIYFKIIRYSTVNSLREKWGKFFYDNIK